MQDDTSARVRSYYNAKPETCRLETPCGNLELIRSREIIRRQFGNDSLDVLDVGAGTGAYSFWLAEHGHRVTFVDLGDAHVTAARERNEQATAKLAAVHLGDARALPLPDASSDLALLMGPLYHLPADQRIVALHEAHRVLRDDGVLVSSYISRYAALMDGYAAGYVRDPAYERMALGDVERGIHDSPDEEQ